MSGQALEVRTSVSLPDIWVKMADARAHSVVNGGEIVKGNVWDFSKNPKYNNESECSLAPTRNMFSRNYAVLQT